MTRGLSAAEYLGRRNTPKEGCGVADCPTPHDTGHDHPSPRHGPTVILDFTDPESRTMRTVRAEQAARTRR